jgi:hypothetical protein
MYLLKKQIEMEETITQIEFEKVADDLLMISVNYDTNDQGQVPSYWRLLGHSPNPPLEIGINTDKGFITNMTLFVDSDCFKEFSTEEINMLNGNVIVDTDIFKKANDYVDTDGEYFINISDDKIICSFGLHNCIKEAIGNNKIKFLISHSDELCGFEIYDLTESELGNIKIELGRSKPEMPPAN